MNKKIIFFMAAILFAAAAYGQSQKSDIRIIPQSIVQIADSVHIDVVFDIKTGNIGTRQQMIFTPVIKSGSNEEKLPPVLINGRVRHKSMRRAEKLSGKPYGYYVALRSGSRGLNQQLEYKYRTPFYSWMREAQVMIVEQECDCQGSYTQVSVQKISDGINYITKPEFTREFTAAIPFITPPREEIKQRAEKGEAFIIYNVGRSEVVPSLANNYEELQKVAQSVEYVRSEPTAKISGISITSFASPEGTWDFNMSLSERRARDFVTWFRNNNDVAYNVPLRAEGKGEDWTRFRRMAETDAIMTANEKTSVLSIMDGAEGYDQKEARMRQINNGSTYRYMLDNIYPMLRRTEYRIEYSVPEFTLEKSQQLFRTHPSMLSQAEFYAIANEYRKGSEEFIEVFEVAAGLYPEDMIANMNAAAAMLSADKLISARRILENYKNDERAWVYLGILEAKEENYELAGQYFRKAVDAGISDAEPLLRELQRHQQAIEEYQQKLLEWQGYE